MSDPDLTAERGPRAALGADFIIPVLACGLTGYYFVSTLDLVWEARATGIFIGCMLLALCAAQFGLLGLRIGRGAGGFGLGALTENTLFNRQRLALVVLVALFVVSIHWISTTLGLFLVLIGCMWVLGVRSTRMLLAIAFTTAAVVHLVLIHLLASRLPGGIFQKLLSAAGGA
jgi:hypothetical protein